MKNKIEKIINKMGVLLTVTSLLLCTGCKSNNKTVDSTTVTEIENDTTQEQDFTKEDATTEGNVSNENNTSAAVDEEEDTTAALEEGTTVSSEEETTSASEEQTTEAVNNEVPTTAPSTGVETPTTKPVGNVEIPTAAPSTGGTANNELAALVNNILSKNIKSSMSQLEKVVVIHDYLTYNVDYDYDNYLTGNIPGSSYSALGALKTGKAVCSGYAYAFYELAKAAGLEVKYISGTADNGSGNGYQGHAWNQVKIDGVWYNVDTTWDDPTYKGKDPNDHSGNSYGYFLISDATIETKHKPNSNDKATCPKDYDRTAIVKAVVSTANNGKMVYAATESELSDSILSAINSGHEEFVLYMPGENVENWNLINRVFTDNKKPYKISSSDGSNDIGKYYIEKDDNVYCVSSVAELKTALDKNQNRIEQIQLWFYDDELTESNIGSIVNAALAKTGYKAEIFSRSDVMNGMIKCYVSRNDNIHIINNINELESLFNNYSKEEIQNKKIMYTGDTITSDEIGKKVHDITVPKGYYMLWIYAGSYYGVTELNLGDPRDCVGIDNLQDIADYINTNGANSAVGKNFVMYLADGDDSTIYNEIYQKLYEETGYSFYITYNCTYNYIVIMIEGVNTY